MFKTIQKPLIMGILNITPDSFSDGGRYNDPDKALEQCRKMLKEGADIIDIGGESTRPGSTPVGTAQQIARVVPVIEAIRRHLSPNVLISIDTTQSRVAEAAVAAGADIINDISAGEDDALMFDLAADHQMPIILMHKQGTPKTMQDKPYYQDVVGEVYDYLMNRAGQAISRGIAPEKIAIDPGIGFGKRKQDNLDLLAHLDRFTESGYKVLLGTSRKRFMGSLLEISEPTQLITATAITTALGVMAGIKLFRVHDIRENRQAVDIAWAIQQRR